MTGSDVPDSDQSLLRRYFIERDQAAMEQLFLRHAQTAFRIALRETGNAADAEELVQSAFLNVLLKGDHNIANVRGWIMGIVINACRNRIKADVRRRERHETAASEAVIEQPAAVENAEVLSVSLRMVKSLPEHYRLPVSLHFLEGLSFKEIACALALPEDTVRKQTHRGIEQVRQGLAAAGLTASVAIPELLLASPAPLPVPATLTASFKPIIAQAAAKSAAATGATLAGKAAGSISAAKGAAALLLIAATLAVAGHLSKADKPPASIQSNAAPQMPPAKPAAPAPDVLTTAEKLNRSLDCQYANVSAAGIFASLCDRLKLVGKLTPAATTAANDSIVDLKLEKVSGREAFEKLAQAAGLQVQIRDQDIVLDKPVDDAPPVRDPMAPGIGNLLQIVDIKFENLDAKAAAQKLSTAFNVNIYFSEKATAALKDRKIDLDMQQHNGMEVLARLTENTDTQLSVQDGAVLLCLPGEPPARPPIQKPPVKNEDF